MTDEVTRLIGRRVTIGFMPMAATDLDWLVENKGYRQNDAANRAVQVYAFIERELAKGNKKLAFIEEDGSVETVNII